MRYSVNIVRFDDVTKEAASSVTRLAAEPLHIRRRTGPE